MKRYTVEMTMFEWSMIMMMIVTHPRKTNSGDRLMEFITKMTLHSEDPSRELPFNVKEVERVASE